MQVFEILIGLAVLAIISVIIIGAFGNFRDAQTLSGAAEEIIKALREARSRTLASENESQFGVHFESSRLVIFSGQSFVEGAAGNAIHNISSQSEIFNINFSGPDVVFERLTGEALTAGDVSVRLRKDSSKTRTIYVNSAGLIYE